MNNSKYYFYLLIFISSAMLAWLIAAQQLYPFTRPYINSLKQATHATFDRPVLWSALLAGAALGAMLIYAFERTFATRFSGAHYHRFLRGTRIVAEAGLA